MPAHDEVAVLRAHVAELQETIRRLRAAGHRTWPQDWRLTPTCEVLLDRLWRARGALVPNEMLQAAAGHLVRRGRTMDVVTLRAHIHRLRLSLPAGVGIQTCRSGCYALTGGSVEVLDQIRRDLDGVA